MNSEQAMHNKVPQRYFASDLTVRVYLSNNPKPYNVSKLKLWKFLGFCIASL